MSNQLINESSPYLLQHANNPVQWYPWGTEAVAKSKEEDKPIFLSIGYSACHWCHVMEHESFENERIASILNDHFISIKVDREERPDLDQIYMNAVVALRNGQGGWPLSVFLTPDQHVFYGGTYWPPAARMGMPGFDQVLKSVLDAFQNKRYEIDEQAHQITAWLNQAEPSSGGAINESLLINAVKTLEQQFDFENGGFGTAPKFPHAMDLELLIRLSRRWSDEHEPSRKLILEMVHSNLNAMAQGGICDHLGGGFSRYSVDESWLVPHFEKMLYDNALLAGAYLEMLADSHELSDSRELFYEEVARETLDYILRDLTDDEGAFFSTEDADSEGVEGKFYVWSKAEIETLLEPETAATFCALYDVTEQGNFEGKNILNLPVSLEVFAETRNLDLEQLKSEIKIAKGNLLAVRGQRIRPALDDKVLVSWNGLAIDSLARASWILNEPKYYDAAAKSANFLLDNLRRDDGRLLHTWRHGNAKIDGYLDDYSYLINALVSLYHASFDERWIDVAVELTQQMIQHFGDHEGGFYFTADDQEALIARTKEFQDSSVPSGNSMAACALVRLGRLLGRSDWIERATTTAKAGLRLMRQAPLASGQMLIVVDRLLSRPEEWVLVGPNLESLQAVVVELRLRLPPGALLICRNEAADFQSEQINQLLVGKTAINAQPTLFICQEFSCQAPIVGLDAIRQQMVI